jgi:hypothetical protein
MRVSWIVGKIVLVYQMPKTASQTLEATLRGARLPFPVLRTHFLSPQNVVELRAGLVSKHADPDWQKDAREQLTFIAKFSRALRIRKFLLACRAPVPPLLVICGVRDVLGAALSSIFENHGLLVRGLECLTLEKCRELLSQGPLCAQFQNWFDIELKATLGIDVYATPFPTQTRYALAQNRLARLLIYRFDFLPCITPVLERFVGYSIPALVNANFGHGKVYGPQYEQAKRFVRLAEKVVMRELDSKLMRHFFSSQERAILAQRWIQPEAVTVD